MVDDLIRPTLDRWCLDDKMEFTDPWWWAVTFTYWPLPMDGNLYLLTIADGGGFYLLTIADGDFYLLTIADGGDFYLLTIADGGDFYLLTIADGGNFSLLTIADGQWLLPTDHCWW